MLSILLIWLYIFFLSLGYGLLFFHFVKKINIFTPTATQSFEFVSLLGLLVMGSILCISSIFVNMGLQTHLFMTIPAILSLFYLRKEAIESISYYFRYFSKNKYYWIFCSLFFLIIGIQVLKTPFGYDAGLYHAQTILWFANYKAIIGLGNIHGNLAFNSNFHLLAAFFSMSFLQIHSFQQVVGSYMLFMFTLHCLAKVFTSKNSHSIFYIGTLLFLFIYFRDWINTPSPDIPATIYILLSISILLQKAQNSQNLYNISRENHNTLQTLDTNYAALLLIATALLAIKLSAICVVFSILAIPIYCKWKLEHLYFAICLGIFCVSPWLLRNFILSGYLIYPFPSIDIFDVDWKLPISLALEDKTEIYYFTRYNARYPRFVYMDEAYIQQILPKSWFPLWFSDLWWINKVLFVVLVLAFFAIPSLILVQWKRKLLTNYQKSLFFIYLFAWIGVLFWFFQAPDFRFGYGFIFAVVLLSGILVLEYIEFLYSYVKLGLYVVCTVFLLHSIRLEYSEYQNISHVAILPEEYPKIATKIQQIGEIQLQVPLQDYLCNIELLPCTPFPNPKLKMRGKTIEDGFRIEK
jgi:hypothetical protein